MKVIKDQLTQLRTVLSKPIDLFVCCGSYELRSRSIAENLDLTTVRRAVVAENKNLSQYVGENSAYLRDLFGAKGIDVADVAIDTMDPIITADNLGEALKATILGSEQNLLVDITTFTHESLLILFKLLSIYVKASDHLRLAYADATGYGSDEGFDYVWLSKGVAEVRSVLGFSGEILPSRKTHLIVLVGYEHERAARLIEVFEPNVLSLGYGKASTKQSQEIHSASRHFYERLFNRTQAMYSNVYDFDFICTDPLDSRAAVLRQVGKFPNYNSVVAPMNTKISTFGSALAAMENTSIQLCYAQAVQYNYHHYSTPGDFFYLIDAGNLGKS